MSDVVREYLVGAWSDIGLRECADPALQKVVAALDAERAEHERIKCRLREAVLLLKDKGVSAETLERLED
jgi:hypothetical protein